MQTYIPETGSRTHRHFVAVPLFLLALVLPLLLPHGGASRTEAPTGELYQWEAAQDQPFSLPDGTKGVLFQGAALTTGSSAVLQLRDGSVLASSPAAIRMQAGDASLTGFHGALHVTYVNGTLSVAALTTPVLLRHGGFAFVLPQGMQRRWTLDALPRVGDPSAVAAELAAALSVPADFYRDQLLLLGPDDDAASSGGVSSRPSDAPLASLFQFPAAHERSLEAWAEQAADALRQSLLSGDDAIAGQTLADPTFLALLSKAADGQRRVLALLAAGFARPGVALQLLPALHDPDVRLLSLLHPGLRAAAWFQPLDDLSADDRAVALLEFPSADVLPDAASPLTVRQWETAAQAAWNGPSRSQILSIFLSALDDFRARAERSGYPDRLRRYAGHVVTFSSSGSNALASAGDALAPWQHLLSVSADISTDPLPPPSAVTADLVPAAASSSSVSSVASPTTEQADAARESVRQQLGEHGAAFSTQTVIQIQTATVVAVRSILFPAPDGDHSYDFTLDTATNQVRDIRKDGTALPLPLSLEAFYGWVKGE